MLIGVLLAVAAMPVSSKQQKKNTAGEQSEDMQKNVLEEKLEAFLENTEGVGKVQVILFLNDTATTEIYTLSLPVALPTSVKKVKSFQFFIPLTAMPLPLPADTRPGDCSSR